MSRSRLRNRRPARARNPRVERPSGKLNLPSPRRRWNQKQTNRQKARPLAASLRIARWTSLATPSQCRAKPWNEDGRAENWMGERGFWMVGARKLDARWPTDIGGRAGLPRRYWAVGEESVEGIAVVVVGAASGIACGVAGAGSD